MEGDDYDETRLDIKEHLGHIQDRKKAARKVSTIIEKGQYNSRLPWVWKKLSLVRISLRLLVFHCI